MPLQTSPERPVPVRVVSLLLGQYIARLGRIWVEGQVTGLSRRPGARTAFLTLRDPLADISLPVTCPDWVLDGMPTPLSDGASVIVAGKPDFYAPRGTLSLAVSEIRPVGIGELLARLEQLRRMLAAEGLFAADRKRSPPFLPTVVGLICGRASAAERDVVENARRRWPAVRFRVREVAVQGVNAVPEVCAALHDLDADPEVDVIVVTRGGGSVEDLLPFSNEALVRAVAACTTPVVSAIGHETDAPLLDLVADIRASTPTDAAKRVVPNVREEQDRVATCRQRARRAIRGQVHRQEAALAGLRSRPALADPARPVLAAERQVRELRDRARRAADGRLDRAHDDVRHLRARVRVLSPAATLARGYAVVQRADGTVVRRPADVEADDPLRLRLAEGELAARVAGPATLG
jgi:exodeoxyribonuclease VII large subunit